MRPALRVVRGGAAPPRPKRLHTVGSTRFDVERLQAWLKNASLQMALAVESCGPKLAASDQTAWTDLAQRVLKFASTDPGSINSAARDQGLALAGELNAWGDRLRAAGCTAPVPDALPVPTPGLPDDEGGSSGGWLSDIKEIAELALLALLAKSLTSK